MATKKVQNDAIEIKKISPKHLIVTIEGDSDLVLNKMNDVTKRYLMGERNGKAKDNERPCYWEEVITSLHWRDGKPDEYSEEAFKDALINNAPCISGFALKRSWGDAVIRNEIDKYRTKFDNALNFVGQGDLLAPITFAEHNLDSKLMSPKKGSPVSVTLNRFSGWSADIEVSFLDTVYSVEQLVNIINLAGFGLGIGSGRSSGYGRYHVTKVIPAQ